MRGGALGRKYLGLTLAERVILRTTARHASRHVATPCWLWTGACTSSGYGIIKPPHGGTAAPVYVHRATWEDVNGPVPDGLELDHLCDVRGCARPDHLEPVTHLENQRRAARRRLQAA